MPRARRAGPGLARLFPRPGRAGDAWQAAPGPRGLGRAAARRDDCALRPPPAWCARRPRPAAPPPAQRTRPRAATCRSQPADSRKKRARSSSAPVTATNSLSASCRSAAIFALCAARSAPPAAAQPQPRSRVPPTGRPGPALRRPPAGPAPCGASRKVLRAGNSPAPRPLAAAARTCSPRTGLEARRRMSRGAGLHAFVEHEISQGLRFTIIHWLIPSFYSLIDSFIHLLVSVFTEYPGALPGLGIGRSKTKSLPSGPHSREIDLEQQVIPCSQRFVPPHLTPPTRHNLMACKTHVKRASLSVSSPRLSTKFLCFRHTPFSLLSRCARCAFSSEPCHPRLPFPGTLFLCWCARCSPTFFRLLR